MRRSPVAARPRGPSAAGNRARRTSDGLLVEASIVARLLGIRLLTLDATVALVPAEVTARTPSRGASPARTPPRPASLPPAQPGAADRRAQEDHIVLRLDANGFEAQPRVPRPR